MPKQAGEFLNEPNLKGVDLDLLIGVVDLVGRAVAEFDRSQLSVELPHRSPR